MTGTQLSFADFAKAKVAITAAPEKEAEELDWRELAEDVCEIQNSHDNHTASASLMNYRMFLCQQREWTPFGNSERVRFTDKLIEIAAEIIGKGCEPTGNRSKQDVGFLQLG